MHPPHTSIWDLLEAIEGVPSVPFECHVPPMSSSTIVETLHGTIWSLISPLLTTDDVVQCRTVARRWNVGCRYGELGDIFFEFLENDPFVRQWYRNVEGNKVCTKSKKSNPFVESFRQWGFMHPKQLPSHVRRLPLAMRPQNLMKDASIREFFRSKGYYECDDVDSMPNDRLSS